MSRSHFPVLRGLVGCAAFGAISGCGDRTGSLPTDPAVVPVAAAFVAPPAGLVNVTTPAGDLHLLAYTGVDFSGTPQDPINLIFTGNKDPRVLRAALMALDGDRSAFDVSMDCTWKDAVGGVQTSYGAPEGWAGSAIQLECGEYGPIRFHVRFFDVGSHTIAGAHFEILIPGTTSHQVISWEAAEQFVMLDFIRTGLLGLAPATTDIINAAPTFREIPAVLYNGLPPELRMVAGGGLADVAAPVGIPTDGRATLLHVGGSAPILPEVTRNQFTIPFGQVIPKPFCASGPLDFVFVAGPVEFEHQIVVSAAGVYTSRVEARGTLAVTPVDVLQSPPVPSGPTMEAEVRESYHSTTGDGATRASLLRQQTLFPTDAPGGGSLKESLMIGPAAAKRYDLTVKCGEQG